MKKEIVVKSNNLIEEHGNFNSTELKLLSFGISLIYRYSENLQSGGYKIPINKFLERIGHKGSTNRTTIRRIAQKMIEKSVVLNKGEEEEVVLSWLHKVLLTDDYITLVFHIDLKDHLINLKETLYTKYFLDNILSLKSKYSIKIYELCKQYEKVHKRNIKLQKLKNILGLENKYKIYADFQERILKVVKKEINEKTDIRIDYLKIKTGRKITDIEFTIKTKHKKRPILKIAKEIPPRQDTEEEKEESFELEKIYNEYHKLSLEKKEEILEKAKKNNPFALKIKDKQLQKKTLIQSFLSKNKAFLKKKLFNQMNKMI